MTFEGVCGGGGGLGMFDEAVIYVKGGGYHKHCHVTHRLKLNKTTVLMRIYSRVANPHFIPRATIYCGAR